jgi:dihydroxy-acid dehydratase
MPRGGVALGREWLADLVEISYSAMDLDGLLLEAARPEELAGMLLAALRLDLPTVCTPPACLSLSASLVALGFTPGFGDPAATAVSLTESAGPGILVHLAALAREAGVAGFGQMLRVLAAETSEVAPAWLHEHGVPGLLASLGDTLHEVPTVAGNLKESLPPAPPAPEEHSRLVFVKARASGAEAVCRVRQGATEVSGECRVFGSEEDAVSAVRKGKVGEGAMLVVVGCGPRGGPGLLRLEALGRSLHEAGLEVPVMTDGLAPEGAVGNWISLFTPEAAAGSVLSLLRDGDILRIDLTEGRIRTRAREIDSREPGEVSNNVGTAYAARYARTALSALEGAGFG